MIREDVAPDVIEVEGPGVGDETPPVGIPFDPEGESAYFAYVNRNKPSIEADSSRGGREHSELIRIEGRNAFALLGANNS
jgi:crotonobetainyl-CoA:carnitine CoA-transferase CaiB-like acyl-CoA transferase